ICNGFQVLVKAGILPGELDEKQKDSYQFAQSVTLTHNDSGKFEDRWVYLKRGGDSVWTKGVKEIAYYPVAHAEGKFVTRDDKVLKALHDNGQIAFRYVSAEGAPSDYPHNPNGSVDDIAGITDVSGRILGLMPHPERHFFACHHPRWTREPNTENKGDGARIFQNGVDYVKKELL
ncbi:MAG: phosphoribosylformylglycinamidine synthase subunit PurQ, partial [Candidatus Omnitrophica bacterium]|nr:phosphoribosylformylglycinamidine synthase subunit PurQ [Candidatus Omnitrophota bacterium]